MLRRIIAYSLVVIALIPLALLLIWVMVKSPPPGYTKPTDFSTPELVQHAKEFQAASVQLQNTRDDPSGQTRLDVTFTDVGITSQIRILPPDDLRRLPDWLSNPQVVFTSEAMVIMGDVEVGGTEATISLHMVPRVTEDGNVSLRLDQTRAGRVPLPEAVNDKARSSIEERIEDQRAKINRRNAGSKDQKEQLLALEIMEAGLRLLNGQEAVIDTRKADLVIERIVLQDKRLRLIGRNVNAAPPQTTQTN